MKFETILWSLRREYHSRRMARFTFWVVLCGIVVWVVDAYTHAVPLPLLILFRIAVFIAAIYYLLRLVRFMRRHLLWRLSRRLIVTYVFIAFVPIALIVLMVLLGVLILNGQFAAFLVRSRLQNYLSELQHLDRVVARQALHTKTRNSEEMLDALQEFCVTDLGQYPSSFPGLRITLRDGSQARAFLFSGAVVQNPVSAPPWLPPKGLADIVEDGGAFALRTASSETTPAGSLTLILSAPLTSALLDRAGAGIGPVGVLLHRGRLQWYGSPGGRGRLVRLPSTGDEVLISSNSLVLPKAQSWLDLPVAGFSGINPVEWQASTYHVRREAVLVLVRSRLFPLNQHLLSTLGGLPNIPVDTFVAVGAVFLVIEIIALVIGVTLTRTITSNVNRLQKATERVKAGDFSHRIGLPPRDQLSALSGAFDSMTASVERLLVESREKTRLEGELRIAREVQSQLFPRSAPEVPGLKLYGVCRPAREVSGDYYDFLKLDRGRLGLILGDVSGKGIFAALLMAGIQSAVHAQFYDGQASGGLTDTAGVSPACLVGRLNRQLYANTPEAKYATFFYAVYDRSSGALTYTNAGHPAPFLFRRDALVRLDSGGTVLGLFPHVRYEQAQVHLEPGDLLLAFSDGMTEPENSYAEEFGERRLIGAVRQALDTPPELLTEEIYRHITDWTGSDEPQDDMTMLYLKAVE